MKKLKDKLRLKYMNILVFAIFFLLSLRVINWFEYPYLMISGDFRPPLVREAFVKHVIYTWDEIDFGMPSVYQPRILVPSYFFITTFQTLGASFYASEMITLFLMCFLSSTLMFILIKRLTNGNIVASFIAAIYLTSNIYLLNDREVSAIGFLDVMLVILPCLIAFTEGIVKKSRKLIVCSGLLFVLTYGSFPNFRISLLCFITLLLTLIFLYINNGLGVCYRRNDASKLLNVSFDIDKIRAHIKDLSLFITCALSSSLWVAVIVLTHFDAFLTTYKQMWVSPTTLIDIRLHDVLRLITKWGFYSGNLGKPYIPYANAYLHDPLIIVLSYLPPILAFASLLVCSSHKSTVYFSAIAAFSLFLTSGLNPFSSQLYPALAAYIPLMIAFREPAQWSFFIVFSYSILMGLTVSTLCTRLRNKASQIFTLGLVIMILLSSSYPLTTGDVARNWLNTDFKGSYFPNSYTELDSVLSNKYWTLMLPQRDVYVVYNFSGIPFGTGNPYPLIFSKPIIAGVGTEYMPPANPDLIDKIYESVQTTASPSEEAAKFLGMLGIGYLVLEKSFVIGNTYPVKELKLNGAAFNLVREWDEVALFNNTHALQKVYNADDILNYTAPNDMYQVIEKSDWKTLQHSVFFDSSSSNELAGKALKLPENLIWEELSPTSYEVHAKSKGAFILVFLESYDGHWKAFAKGKPIPETNHQKVNGFANSWLIDSEGDLTISIQYDTQNAFVVSAVASVILPSLLLAFLSRRDLMRIASIMRRKVKSMKTKFKQKM